jgi:hypothetical protein
MYDENPIIQLDQVFAVSKNVVAREIEGDLIIVPVTSGIGDLEDELYSLNSTGKAIWSKLDGIKSLREIINQLIQEYEVTADEALADVHGLLSELIKRQMVVERPRE